MTFHNGLNSVLRPEESVLVFFDHQPCQLANPNSQDRLAVVSIAMALAKVAKASLVAHYLDQRGRQAKGGDQATCRRSRYGVPAGAETAEHTSPNT